MKCAISFLAYATFVSWAIALTQSTEAATQTHIVRDVAIVGGGAAGTYAAVRLRKDYNISVILIETDDHLVSIRLAFQQLFLTVIRAAMSIHSSTQLLV